MGRYVYLEDKIIDKLKEVTLRDVGYYGGIYNKLSQKPKTLEELGYSIIKNEKNERVYEIKANDDGEMFEIKFDKKHINEIQIGGYSFYNIEELEAILNKAQEIFKEG